MIYTETFVRKLLKYDTDCGKLNYLIVRSGV